MWREKEWRGRWQMTHERWEHEELESGDRTAINQVAGNRRMKGKRRRMDKSTAGQDGGGGTDCEVNLIHFLGWSTQKNQFQYQRHDCVNHYVTQTSIHHPPQLLHNRHLDKRDKMENQCVQDIWPQHLCFWLKEKSWWNEWDPVAVD